MPIFISINEKHIDDLINFWIEKQRKIKENISLMEKEAKEVGAIILQLKSGGTSNLPALTTERPFVHDNQLYSEDWQWVRKIEFAMELENRALTTKEIVRVLSSFDAEIAYDPKKAVSSVSSILSTKSEWYDLESDTDELLETFRSLNKDFMKMTGDGGELLFFSKKLFDRNNKISQEKLGHGTRILDNDMPF